MAAFRRFRSRMAVVEPKDPNSGGPGSDAPGFNAGEPLEPNSSAEDFFSKMNHDFRRPKPSEEAVAAALQAIQALAGDAAIEGMGDSLADSSADDASQVRTSFECHKCGGVNSDSNRFCGFCGAPMSAESKPGTGAKTTSAAGEQHIHHHHYHHHYLDGAARPAPETAQGYSFRPSLESLSAGESPAPTGADAILRKLVQEWVLLCNGKRVDELAALYARDGVLIRPGAAIARGHAAIKELLQADLDAGLGDVQLECSDVGTLGEVACLTGTSRMLCPVSPANRQERAGKFLMVVRREGSSWGILADIWSVDGPYVNRQQK